MPAVPVILFRHMTPSPALEAVVRSRVAWLAQFHPQITGCRVRLTLPTRRHRQGNPLQVRIDISLLGGDVVVNEERTGERARGDAAEQAIRCAFDIARRRLEDAARIRRGDVKAHAPGD